MRYCQMFRNMLAIVSSVKLFRNYTLSIENLESTYYLLWMQLTKIVESLQEDRILCYKEIALSTWLIIYSQL
jgi:hypothetical protein